MGTVHYCIVQLDTDTHPANARRRRYIYAFWHETILFPTRLGANTHALISHHADGELIAQTCRHLRIKTVRGSSRRGGTQALFELMEISKTSHLMVTPDGPRGPRRRVQMGLIFLASHTGLPIIPCGVGYEKAWRFGSWDRFALPWPWTRAVAVVSAAIHVPPRLRRVELDRYRDLVEQRLLEATERAERVATGGRAGAPPLPLAA
jgi:lysophospholipid acyltransferase (LPLAT)-like uncharacterized protein